MGVRGTSVLGFAAIIITVEEDEVEGRRRGRVRGTLFGRKQITHCAI